MQMALLVPNDILIWQENEDYRRQKKGKEQYYSLQFRTTAHERYFPSVDAKKLLMERRVGLIPNLSPQFGREVNNRGWGNLATYPALASSPIVKEFYVCLEGTLRGADLMYPSTLRGHHWKVNLVAVIVEEIKSCARTVSSMTPLGHPSLITHLCEIMGVDVSTLPLERPRKELDEAYFTYYCNTEEQGPAMPPHQAPRARMEALYRSQMAAVEMISGLYDPPEIRHCMSMDEFRARMAWPEGSAHADGGDAADEDEDSND
ncbi:hypothetical protein LR48_Vigan02g078900 [Vigna angularis]|uniref:Uncharacterized protein n=1 Tax=Phaseolus angularis TaxID=3914 RepID=A0A0L9TWS8_PHAAN|nr:hypothetical protein LR48_Vigan02g078900 [Vigna angularis]